MQFSDAEAPHNADPFRDLQRSLPTVRRMAQRSRSLVDWLLLRAWVEPDHEQQLRVVIARPGETDQEEAFADADRAASFVRGWLQNLVHRWEAGERTATQRRWGGDEGGNDTGDPRKAEAD